MRSIYGKQNLIVALVWAALILNSLADQPKATASPAPVMRATPVQETNGIGKLLGKTMKMVSFKGSRSFLQNPKSNDHADRGAPEFDLKRNESPIRTARLFKIQMIPPAASPVE